MKMKKSLLLIMAVVFVSFASSCNIIHSFTEKIQGKLFGDDYKILSYDDYGNNTLTAQGRNVNIGLFENYANTDKSSKGFQSEVLEITIEGKQLLHVGSTLIFAEKGVDMLEDYDINSLKDAKTTGQGIFVPLNRSVNHFMNKIGKKKTIIVRSQQGIIIGVYQGNRVSVEVPDDLPKMTRIIIDGKSLYIHRADYMIFDTGLFK